MSDMKHVLFVCTGNTCRSPMAEGLFLKAVADRGDYEVSSAGVAASKGTPCSPETAAILKKRAACWQLSIADGWMSKLPLPRMKNLPSWLNVNEAKIRPRRIIRRQLKSH